MSLPYEFLKEFMAYAEIEPFGSRFETYRDGVMASTMVKLQANKGHEKYTPSYFFPTLSDKPAQEVKTEIDVQIETMRAFGLDTSGLEEQQKAAQG